MTIVERGRVRFFIEGKEQIASAGDVLALSVELLAWRHDDGRRSGPDRHLFSPARRLFREPRAITAVNEFLILEQFKLHEQVALVTGASTGLGAAIAVALAEAGAQVACHGNTKSPESTCERIRSFGGLAHAISGDLSQPDTPESLVTKTLERFGRLDILINNAGTIRRAPAVDYSIDDWTTVIVVNLNSVFRLSQVSRAST